MAATRNGAPANRTLAASSMSHEMSTPTTRPVGPTRGSAMAAASPGPTATSRTRSPTATSAAASTAGTNRRDQRPRYSSYAETSTRCPAGAWRPGPKLIFGLGSFISSTRIPRISVGYPLRAAAIAQIPTHARSHRHGASGPGRIISAGEPDGDRPDDRTSPPDASPPRRRGRRGGDLGSNEDVVRAAELSAPPSPRDRAGLLARGRRGRALVVDHDAERRLHRARESDRLRARRGHRPRPRGRLRALALARARAPALRRRLADRADPRHRPDGGGMARDFVVLEGGDRRVPDLLSGDGQHVARTPRRRSRCARAHPRAGRELAADL